MGLRSLLHDFPWLLVVLLTGDEILDQEASDRWGLYGATMPSPALAAGVEEAALKWNEDLWRLTDEVDQGAMWSGNG